MTEDPAGVSAVSQHRFFELAASEVDDSLLGLHVAGEMDLRDIRALVLSSGLSGNGRRSGLNSWRNTRRR
jgi:hypothetical protein